MNIEVGSLDPSLSHFGVARLLLNLDTLKFTVLRLNTIVTEAADKATKKVVRKNSTQLGRCKIIAKSYPPLVAGCKLVFAEVPTGAQSSSAMWAFGAVTMAVAFCPVPVIQVQPTETKMATVGTKTASKEEMIEWAAGAYPDAPFKRYEKDLIRRSKKTGAIITNKPKGQIHDEEEHVCDALAVAEAGILTDQFQQLLPLMRQAMARAA
jgi:Holliday junction resolvasome RuvABC endonuclease subunit